MMMGLIDSGRSAAAPYAGPGDVVAGLTNYWGLDANIVAYIGGPCIGVLDQAGANALTVNIAANGFLDTTAITSWVAAHSVTTIKVAQVYDQVGTNHAAQGTLANMPELILNAIGSLPGISFSGTQWLACINPLTQAQVLSLIYIAKRTTFSGTFGDIFSSGNGDVQVGFDTSTGNAFIYAGGSVITAAAAENQFHDFQAVLNNTTSVFYIDGGSNPASGVGVNGFNGTSPVIGAASIVPISPLTGLIPRVGLYGAVGFTAPQAAALHANAHTNWGV